MSRSAKALVPPNYPDRVFALRKRLRLTQQQLADRIETSFASVNRWENGQNRPTRSAWKRLLKLANGELPPPPDNTAVRIFPDWSDRAIRVNITQIVSYRQARESDMRDQEFDPLHEFYEYTVLFMNGGHSHIVHMCEIEIDRIFGVDTSYVR